MDGINQGKVLGELESEIMAIIWRESNYISVKEVTVQLQKKRKIAYTTVMTIMGRLVDKGILKRTIEGKAFQYKSAYSRERFLSKVTKQMIKNLVSSFGESAIAHFAQELDKIPAGKKQKLLKLLKEADGK